MFKSCTNHALVRALVGRGQLCYSFHNFSGFPIRQPYSHRTGLKIGPGRWSSQFSSSEVGIWPKAFGAIPTLPSYRCFSSSKNNESANASPSAAAASTVAAQKNPPTPATETALRSKPVPKASAPTTGTNNNNNKTKGPLAPAGPKPPKVPTSKILRTVIAHLWPRREPGLRARVVGALSLLVLAKAFNISVPFFFKAIVDSLSTTVGGTATIALPLGLSVVGMVVGYGIARFGASISQEARSAVFISVSQTASRTIATRVYGHIMNLDLNWHLNRTTGAITNVIERGTKGVGTVLTTTLFNIVPTGLELAMVCTILWINLGFSFALTTFVAVGVYTAFTVVVTEWRTKFRRRMNQMDRRAAQHAVDGMLNYETVKYFGNENHEVARYNEYLRQYSRAAELVQHSLSFLNSGQNLILSTALTFMMYLTVQGVLAGAMTVGDLVLVNTLMFQLSMPLNMLGMMWREINQAITDMENMFSILAQQTLVVDKPNAREYTCTQGGKIEFKNVAFSYVPGHKLIEDLSFVVEPGTTVAFVGTSGCGKSTILRLLYRFYDVQRGQIFIDGVDITEYQLASVRRYIGIVPQDTVLFNDTIRYNIRYGKLDASDAEVDQAAELAALTTALSRMPKGLDTMVGERGLKLSGGEKQRVALARVFLKKPPILLCDEATSALDTHTESSILQSLWTARRSDTTTLVIAHRLSTVRNADKIVVLHQGRAHEIGSHDELIQRKGLYYDLWNQQQHEALENLVTSSSTPSANSSCANDKENAKK